MSTKDLTVRILGDASNFNKAVSGIGNTASKAGAKLTKTLTPAAAAVGVAMGKIGSSFNDSRDAIIVGTGASGKALDGLMASSKKVAGQVPNDFGDVGSAIADVNTRLGLTGPTLEETSKKALDLSRITGTDLSANIRSASRVVRDWGKDSEDAADVMDLMFRASQNTGIGFDRLGNSVVQFGAPLRQVGFTMDESIALLAGFEAQGVNTEAVMSGLRQGLGRIARAGEEPVETFRRVTEEIAAAGSAGEANALSLELFGSRAGPDMAAAIREGRFEIDELVAGMQGSEGSIDDAADATLRFSDRMKMMRNRVIGVIGPFGELGGVMGGAVAALGPLLFGLGQMAPVLGKAKAAAVRFAASIKTITAASLLSAAAIAGVAAAVGYAAVEIATARTVGDDWEKSAESWRKTLAELSDEFYDSEDPTEAYRESLRQMVTDNPELLAAMRKTGQTVDDLTGVFVDGEGRTHDWDDALRDAMLAAGVGADEVDTLIQSIDAHNRALATGKSRQDDLAVVMGETTDEAGEQEEAVEGLTEAQEAAVQVFEEAERALQDLNKEILAATRSSFDLERQTLELEGAYDDFNDAATENALVQLDASKSDKEKETSARNLRLEEIQLAEQALTTAQAFAEESGAVDGSRESAQLQITKLGELQDKYPELRGEIQVYIDKLLETPGTVNTAATLDTFDATQRANILLQKYRDLGRTIDAVVVPQAGSGSRAPGVPLNVGATGGIVTKPTMALIGEAGPEAVVPLNKTPGSSPLPEGGMGGGGNSYSITVNALDPQSASRAVIDAIKVHERRNGSGWRS